MSKTLYIRTLSPVFVGSGAIMQPFEYVFDQTQEVLYRIAPDKVFDYITQRHERAADLVHPWIENSTRAIDSERDNQKLSSLLSGFTIGNFIRSKLDDPALADDVEQQIRNGRLSMYAIPCQSLKGLQRSNRRRNTSGQVEERQKLKKAIAIALKTACQELYLPGSSLKGAIRTALLFRVVREARGDVLNKISHILDETFRGISMQRSSHPEKTFAEKLEQYVFYCGSRDGRDRVQEDDAKYDLMKLIAISDSEGKPSRDAGRIAAIDVYQSNGEVQTQTPAVEALAAQQVFQVRFTLDTPFLLKAKQLLEQNNSHFGKQQWIGFRDKFERLFRVPLNNLTQETVAAYEEQVLESIFDACRAHSQAVRERESQLANKQKLNSLATFYTSLEAMREGATLKVGYASGFPATTIFLALASNNQLRPTMQRILDTFGIGKPQRARGKAKVDVSRFPTSRRYESIIKDTISTNPVGWIHISLAQQSPSAIGVSPGTSVPTPSPPPNTVKAEIIDTQSKPPKVKIVEGKHTGQVTILPGVHLQNLGLSTGSVVYVLLVEKKGKLEKAEYKGKLN